MFSGTKLTGCSTLEFVTQNRKMRTSYYDPEESHKFLTRVMLLPRVSKTNLNYVTFCSDK